LVLFDDGIKYRGIVAERIDDTTARIIFDDGDLQIVNFPDPDVEFDLPEDDLVLVAAAEEETIQQQNAIKDQRKYQDSLEKPTVADDAATTEAKKDILDEQMIVDSPDEPIVAATTEAKKDILDEQMIVDSPDEPIVAATTEAKKDILDEQRIVDSSDEPIVAASTEAKKDIRDEQMMADSPDEAQLENKIIEKQNLANDDETAVDDKQLAVQLQAEEFRASRRLRARNDAERQAERDAQFAARLQAQEEREAARKRRLERSANKPPKEPKPLPKAPRRRRDDGPTPVHVLFGNVQLSTPDPVVEEDVSSKIIATPNKGESTNHERSMSEVEQPIESATEENDEIPGSKFSVSEGNKKIVVSVPDAKNEGQQWCSVCILEDANALLTLWCCKKRLCESCLGRIGDFGYRCFFCRSSVPPRRIRAMLHHEAEWPPSRPSSITNFTPRFMSTNAAKSAPRRARNKISAIDAGEEARSSLDFVGEVRRKGGLWWYSARDGETIDYIATSLRASTSHILRSTRAARLSNSDLFENASSYLKTVSAATDAMRRGQLLRLPHCDPAAESGISSAAWIVPPRIATELLEGEVYTDPEDGRVWYCARDDQTLESAARCLEVDAMSPETTKLAHLASRRSSGHFSRFSNRKAKLKARTLIIAPKEAARTEMRKPCAQCRLRGDRGAYSCRLVLQHETRNYDSPKPKVSDRVRVRFILGEEDDEQSAQDSIPPVWGWFFGTVTRVSDNTIFVIYDNEEPTEDALQWPNEDIVVLALDDPPSLLKREPPQEAIECLVGQSLKRKEDNFTVLRSYMSLVEGFDGLAVSVAIIDQNSAEEHDEDHLLLVDLAGSGFIWEQPKAARLANALLHGLDSRELMSHLPQTSSTVHNPSREAVPPVTPPFKKNGGSPTAKESQVVDDEMMI